MRKFSTNINSTADFHIKCPTLCSKFFVSQYRKISLGNTSVYQKISGSENFYASERGGEFQDFLSKMFCLTVPKISVGNPLLFVALISGIEKVRIRGGSIMIFRRKFFVSQYRKISLGNTSVYQKISGSENFYASERGGEFQDFLSKIFCLTVPKISVGESFTVCCINFRYRKSSDKRGGEYQDFPSKIFCLAVPKNFVGEPFSVSLISGTEKVYE